MMMMMMMMIGVFYLYFFFLFISWIALNNEQKRYNPLNPISVLTYYGVNAVFENAIRAALVSRRQQRFWLAGFKRVQRPLLQVSPVLKFITSRFV